MTCANYSDFSCRYKQLMLITCSLLVYKNIHVICFVYTMNHIFGIFPVTPPLHCMSLTVMQCTKQWEIGN